MLDFLNILLFSLSIVIACLLFKQAYQKEPHNLIFSTMASIHLMALSSIVFIDKIVLPLIKRVQ
jgi:CHASE2 domain-containing sensor protein